MPSCSNVEEDLLAMDDVARYFPESSPTLNFDELLNGNSQHDDEDLFDWDTENPVMNDDDYNFNNSPNVDFTDGVEGEIPEYVGDIGNEVGTNFVVPFSVWPPVRAPFNCSYCHLLREIIHENGENSMRLEIHGRIGFISHAIHEMRTNVIDGPPIVNYEMFDFTMQSMESVKQFIVQYCQSRTQEGYVLLPDPLSVYYDALCYGLNCFNNVDPDELNPPSDNTEARHIGAEEENRTPANTNDTRTPRPGLASQRQRTRALTLTDLTRRFHVPINTAAKELEICTTVLKKKCRQFGVKRWPSRAVISKTKKLSILETSLREGNGSQNASREIETLRKQLEDIYACRDVHD
ncbi:uncharacterized protein LOC113283818 isoform X2 [Papaver somniferum]|uniref:uncharacterized protein LOC113283818 isoform X2 n=1 Tax=Papaver somniferum TaxID=3469 RepID=UPI000E6FC663|nr:uncharacterized protein LOC113283818 isoform X2 [Papaver somniferum]